MSRSNWASCRLRDLNFCQCPPDLRSISRAQQRALIEMARLPGTSQWSLLLRITPARTSPCLDFPPSLSSVAGKFGDVLCHAASGSRSSVVGLRCRTLGRSWCVNLHRRLGRPSGHGRFPLQLQAATAIFERVARTVSEQWRAQMRQAGVSERDCEAIRNAFVYEGLFHENVV